MSSRYPDQDFGGNQLQYGLIIVSPLRIQSVRPDLHVVIATSRHSSPSFRSQQVCSHSNLSQKITVGRQYKLGGPYKLYREYVRKRFLGSLASSCETTVEFLTVVFRHLQVTEKVPCTRGGSGRTCGVLRRERSAPSTIWQTDGTSTSLGGWIII